MFLKKLFSIVFIAIVYCGAFNTQALANPLNNNDLFNYLVSRNPANLEIYIRRQTTNPYQVGTVIQHLNQNFQDLLFSANCEATAQVINGSYVPHSPMNDSKAYGVVTVRVTHTCPSALYKLIQGFEANPYIIIKVPNKLHPAVTISN